MITIKTITECDMCLRTDAHTDADFTLIYLRNISENGGDDGVRYRVDLCREHTEMGVGDAWQLGTRWDPDKDQATPPLHMRGRKAEPCPYCGDGFAIGSGMSLHIKSKHPEHWTGPARPVVADKPRKSKKGK